MQVNIHAKTFFGHTHCKYSIVETRLSICTMHNSIDWIKHFSSLLSIFYRWRVANYRWQHGGCNIFLKIDRFGPWQMKTLIRFFFHDLASNNMISIWHIFIWTCRRGYSIQDSTHETSSTSRACFQSHKITELCPRAKAKWQLSFCKTNTSTCTIKTTIKNK